MHADPRFTVVLAATGHPVRRRLLRLLTERFSVGALRTESAGTASAVVTRAPDVLVCDPACGAEVLERIAGGDALAATWVVVLHEDDLPRPGLLGVTRIADDASDHRVLAAVAAAGRLARAGTHAPPTGARVPVHAISGPCGVSGAPAPLIAFGTLTRAGARATLSPSVPRGPARAMRS